MAIWTHHRFATVEQALDYLNDVMVGTVNIHEGADVDGKTLIIHDGTANQTVTFAPAKGRDWTAAEIVAQINAAAVTLANCASLSASLAHKPGAQPNRRLKIFGDPAFTIRGNGTANSDLGYDGPATPANDTTQSPVPDVEIKLFVNTAQDSSAQWLIVRCS